MISSEIAKVSIGTLRSKLSKRVSAPKSNPGLLAPQDGVALGGIDREKNQSLGGKLSAVVSEVRVMLPPGSERSAHVLNGGGGARVETSRSAVQKYANPRPIEVNGQMWNIA